MPRPIRHVDNNHYYMLTNRCVLGKYLLCPDDEESKRIIRACLARAADKCHVELVCFVFMSNHFHLIARFPLMNMSAFMERFQGQLASRMNDHRGRSGTFFGDRYDDQALLDDQVIRDKISYVLNNPVKDGLVRSAERWPGVTSIDCHDNEENTFEGRWMNNKKRRKYKRRKTGDKGPEDALETHEVALHLPAALGGEDEEARRKNLLELVRKDRHRLWAEATGNRTTPPTVVGPEAIEEMDWRESADAPSSSPLGEKRHLGVANTPEKMADYHDKRREIAESYRWAMSKWREKEAVEFPHGTHPPGWRRCVGAPTDAA